MNYEQMYKEARRLLESIYPELSHEKQMLAEKFFPELKESEDERIRKEIIDYIKTGTYHKSWIAWLEKQRKQEKDILEDAILDGNEDGLIAETIRYKHENQAEQKPAEWSEEDETNLRRVEYACMKFFNVDWSLIGWLRKSLKGTPKVKEVENTELLKVRGYLVRDKDDYTAIYAEKPHRGKTEWVNGNDSCLITINDARLVPDIEFEDEPVEVEVTLKRLKDK